MNRGRLKVKRLSRLSEGTKPDSRRTLHDEQFSSFMMGRILRLYTKCHLDSQEIVRGLHNKFRQLIYRESKRENSVQEYIDVSANDEFGT